MKIEKIYIIFIMIFLCVYFEGHSYSLATNFTWSSMEELYNSALEVSAVNSENTNSLKLESESAILIEQNSR